MAILITSPGLVTTGTVGADDIRFITGQITGNGSEVNALAGNDTITTTTQGVGTVSGASVGAALSVNGGGGADSIDVYGSGSTTSANNIVVLGGAGGDTITVDSIASLGAFSNVAGGDGGDQIIANTATYSAIGAGAGSDTIDIGAGLYMATGARIAGGAGADRISGSGRFGDGAGILGGGGADTIALTTLSGSGAYINGDSSSDGGGADSISVDRMSTGTLVRGKGGADTITVSGTLSGSNVIAGNAGGDVITVSGAVTDGFAIKGGQGGDQLRIDDATLSGVSGGIYAGGGTDTITILDAVQSGASNSTITMNGGAGADSIAFSGTIASGASLGVLEISDFGDSKIGTMDTVDLTGLANTGILDFAAGTALSLNSAASLSGAANVATGVFFTGVGISGSVTGGAMTFQGQVSAGLSTAAEYADAATRISTVVGATNPAQGRSVIFTIGSGTDEYLFVQGGSAGTSDDYIVKFNGTSGGAISGTELTFQAD